LAAVIVGLFIAAIAYLQYQRIINVNWEGSKHFYKMEVTHSATLSNVGIPLVSSGSAGFVPMYSQMDYIIACHTVELTRRSFDSNRKMGDKKGPWVSVTRKVSNHL